MGKQLRLDVAQLTDVGRKREHNEDNMAYVIPKDVQVMAKKGALFIVADGMGGHAAGEVASEIAVDTISNVYYQDDSEDVVVSLLHAIKRANALIHQRASENMLRTGMGTTCVAGVLRGNMAYIANVGDSRAYLIRGGQVKQISQDHSWVAEQVRAGLLTEDQARTHAQRNVITRSLGTQADVEVDIFSEQLEEADSLVLCTDGLSGLVSDDELRRIVDQYVPQESVYHLVEKANENGGPDNITAIVVQVQEVGVEPNGRRPVRVGSREMGEDTTVIGMSPGSPVGVASRVGEGRIPSAPLSIFSGPLPDSVTAPQPGTLQAPLHKRSRLFYPTLALLVLLVVALVSGGTYFVFRAGTGANVDQSIQEAQTLITQAKKEVVTNPTSALQQLARAQNLLHDAQNNSPTDSQRTRINNLLNGDFTQTVKNAIMSYNQLTLITTLPCTNTPPSAINDGSSNTHAQTIALLYDSKGTPLRYAVGQDHKLYQITDQNSLINILSDLPTGTQVLSIAGGGQRLFVLLSFSTTPNGPVSYSLGQFLPGQTKFTKNAPIPSSVTQGGQTPKFITASDTDVYVVLTSPATMTTNTVQVLDFNGSDLSSSTKNPRNISLSSSILSVAASPDHELFFLLADGSVWSLPLGGSSPGVPTPVLIEHPISPTLAVSERDFTAKMPVPTVTPVAQSTNGNVQLSVPGATMLAASMVDTMPHLYIVDEQLRRIVDLKVAQTTIVSTPKPATNPTPGKTSSTPTVSGGGVVSVTPTSFQVTQQYQSSSLFAQVKSVVVDPKGVDVLIQNTSSSFSLLSINTSSQNVCA